MTKLPSVTQAFLIHFGISLIIFIVLVAVMRMIWYPADLFFLDGGWQGLKLIAPIDLILGPALTLGFYRPWKKSLKFDMSAIAVVQIAALSYGVYVAYQQRPVALVFAENRFETLSLKDYKAASKELLDNDQQPIKLSEFRGRKPFAVYAENFNKEEYGQYLADVMNGLPELRERSDRYQPIKEARQQITEYRIGAQDNGTSIATTDTAPSGPIAEIPASTKALNETLKRTGVQTEIYTLKARFENGIIEFDPDSFDWIDIRRAPE